MSKSYRHLLIDAKAKQELRDKDIRRALKNAAKQGYDPRNSLTEQKPWLSGERIWSLNK